MKRYAFEVTNVPDSIAIGLEFNSTLYPVSGAYERDDNIYFVDLDNHTVWNIPIVTIETVCGAAVVSTPEGHISESGLIKLMAVIQKPELAKELLEDKSPVI